MSKQTLITIEAADLARIEATLIDIQSRLDEYELTPKPKWLTVAEYAVQVRKSKRTVNRWIKKGRLQTKKEGGVQLIEV